jgi:hypothetical protein
MATGTVLLHIAGASPSLTAPPSVGFSNGVMYWSFDDTTIERINWMFRMPQDYASVPVVKVQYTMSSGITGNIMWGAQFMAVTPGDAQSLETESYDTINTAFAAVATTAGHMREISITISSTDGLAANDLLIVRLERVANDGNDTATGDARLRTVTLEYTTT